MRRRYSILLLVLLSLFFDARTRAAGTNCVNTICGTYCITHDVNFGGYCNPPAEMTTGCIQLFGPDCASMDGAYCCTRSGGGGF